MSKTTTTKSHPNPQTSVQHERVKIEHNKHQKGQSEEREYVPKQPSGSPAKSTR